MPTLGEALVAGIEAYGIDTVFGIPGVHTVELYRGLPLSGIRHVTPRHEQGAGFMADGYWRATGRVAAAFVITGPGLTNILTPMAQAYADSVPMLVVSSVNRRAALGMGGDLHEIRNQSLIAAQAAAFSHTITDPAQLPEVLARAFAVFEGARPGPVHIEVPVDLFSVPFEGAIQRVPPLSTGVDAAAVALAVTRLAGAARPLILAGGGAPRTGLAPLAEALGAPVVMTTNGRGALPPGHPLAVPASPSLNAVRRLIAEADVVLAIGTEIGRTDYDMYDRGGFEVPGDLIRLDIDPQQIRRGLQPEIALCGDAEVAVRALIQGLGGARPGSDGVARADAARVAAWEEIGPAYRMAVGFLDTIRETLPTAPIVGDSTQAIYAGNLFFAGAAPGGGAIRHWFGAATGYGALGYGLPAAIGAARGTGGPVVCVVGDGGLQFSLAELGTAVEERLPLIVLVWNNRGYGEIKSYMIANQIAPVGVDLHTPDFVALGKAYGAEAFALTTLEALPRALGDAAKRPGPTVIEIDEALVLG